MSAVSSPAVPPEQAAALARIEASGAFARALRHRRLLRHLVERCAAGDTASLKESLIAVQVLGRPADRFDPAEDSIVRVEMRRLRARLARYYAEEGMADPWRLALRPGSYQVHWLAPLHPPTVSRAARDLVERGEHFLRGPVSAPLLAQARDRFAAAVRAAPAWAPAWTGLGRAWYNSATSWSVPPTEAAAECQRALDQALLLDPTDALAQTLRAAAHHQFGWAWAPARAGFERARALAPQQAFVHSAFGCHLTYRGLWDEAEAALHEARRLDPHYLASRMHLVNLRLAQGRPDQARAELAAVLDIAPRSAPALALAALIALSDGDPEAARPWAEEALAAAPQEPGYQALRWSVCGQIGVPAERAAASAALRALHSTHLSPYVLALAHARLGESGLALQALQRAISQRDPNLLMLDTDPFWRPLHHQAAWAALTRAWRDAAPGLPVPGDAPQDAPGR
ncbi:tetratricopeptide repeat protein [Ideonella alba]|uniref:Tetratricopeptide repeat protein n=1 Tax=Ideonella alba TaxID=2824118 RepID=A0A941BAL1_9BURK|nr:tetratricopeptide repeat protein [Ideonella alba]MBQ0929925.1 tetratricopeptide repeat protein [Ideonella alba]